MAVEAMDKSTGSDAREPGLVLQERISVSIKGGLESKKSLRATPNMAALEGSNKADLFLDTELGRQPKQCVRGSVGGV